MTAAEDAIAYWLKLTEKLPAGNGLRVEGLWKRPGEETASLGDLRDLLAQRQWRGIESAPRDGTDVLVGRDHATVWVVHVAWYRDGSPESGAEDPGDIGWWSYVRHSVTQEKLEGHCTPTHWMPLPEPPT